MQIKLVKVEFKSTLCALQKAIFVLFVCLWFIVPLIGQNLQPFTGNGDVSICVNNSRVGRKPPKQAKWNVEIA